MTAPLPAAEPEPGFGVLPVPVFLTGAEDGAWHAIRPIDAQWYRENGTVCRAVCNQPVRLAAKHGNYDRNTTPVIFAPCWTCAWTVAAETGDLALDIEAERLRPDEDTRATLERLDAGPLLAVQTAQAILARSRASDTGDEEDEPAHPATIQLLAATSAHRTRLLIPEACSEGDCDHDGRIACLTQGLRAGCVACSLIAGPWAGPREGQFRADCTVTAPCSVLLALAASAGVTGE